MSTPNRVPEGVPTGGQFTASAKAEATISLYANGKPRPYVLRAEPEVTEKPWGTVTNYTAEPITDPKGIGMYGGAAIPARAEHTKKDVYGIPNRAHSFSGGPTADDGRTLMRAEGHGRTHAEAWDRLHAAEREWMATYDMLPNTVSRRAWVAEHGETEQNVALAARIAAADGLDQALEARKALPLVGLKPSTRRAIADADADLVMAWHDYCTQYPSARSHPMVYT